MKRLGKNWKRLHRLVYFSSIAAVTHAMLATTMSKKLLFRDPQAQSELRIYIAILAILLVVRLPRVRKLLKQIPVLLESRRKAGAIDTPGDGAELWPSIHGRESGVTVKPTFLIPNEIPGNSEQSGSGSSFKRINGSHSFVDSPAVKRLPEEGAKLR
jgi:hypothetical protein